MLKIEVINQISRRIAERIGKFNDEYIDRRDERTDVSVFVQKSKLGSFFNGFFDEIFNEEYYSAFSRKAISDYREMLNSILFDNNSNYDVDFHVRRTDEFKKNGRCYRIGNKVKVYAELGEYLGCDVLRSSFSEIKGVVHEIAHATSQKFRQEGQEKETLIGEIESMFMEKIFVDYCMNNIDKVKEILVKDSSKEIPNDQAEDFIYDMFVNGRFLYLERRANFCCSEDEDKTAREDEFRYIVGEIYSTALYEKYKDDPEKTIKKFVKYLKHNSEYNLDETAEVLGIGSSMKEVFSSFENTLEICEENEK